MKILYIDVNATFLNPTRALIAPTILQAAPTRFFGPGYVTSGVLRRGLAAFVETEGPFDVAISNSHIIFARNRDMTAAPRQYRRHYDLTFDPQDLLSLPAIAEELALLNVPRVAILLESDYYNWTDREIEDLGWLDYLIAFGPEFCRRRDELPNIEREAFAKNVTDRWADYARTRADKIASMLHFVAETEFSAGRLEARRASWAVLGISYDARRRAHDALARAHIDIVGESPLRRGLGLAKRLKLFKKESRRMLRFLNLDFQARLESCRYAYTCGSALDMPIRKFFEIPAAGAVLVCQPFAGFEAAGFRNGENAVVCSPEDVVEMHRSLEAEPERAQAIADAGRDLVFRKHSLHARAQQLAGALGSMVRREFAGARWIDGRFQLTKVS